LPKFSAWDIFGCEFEGGPRLGCTTARCRWWGAVRGWDATMPEGKLKRGGRKEKDRSITPGHGTALW